jgi:eukaryotic-like serine/threonine-protein kinase
VSTLHPSRVEELFLAAIDLPAVERKPFLTSACGGDDRLRKEVESLLAHASDDRFMDSKIAPGRGLLTQLGAVALSTEEPLLPADRRIGPYEIKGILGSGGMGVVYVAQQARPNRTVAVKVMRRVLGGITGLSGQKMLRRFEHEAELLGRLQHPGIAQVYEAGTYTVSGETHPFIAMELVKGQPLLSYAEKLDLGSRARMELFARVCDAIQHAHRLGVIHRDLKPANIFVDESGQPKILDFGVARATDRDLAVTSQHTAVGQLIGTLAYMSPEQVVGDQQQVDTRSDVYALGVVLYELLAGKLPYDLTSRSLPEAARLIRDHEPTRLSTINRVFRGDVETIVSKALEKDRDRRYQSASELAEDVRRYLAGEPIAARRDSALYILGKQMKRYRGLVALGFGSFLLVTTLAIIASIQAINARTSAGQERLAKENAESALLTAQLERTRADQSATRLAHQLDASRVERGRLNGLTGNLAVAEELIWPAHLRDPESRQTFYALWELYMHHPLMATVPIKQERPTPPSISPSNRYLLDTTALTLLPPSPDSPISLGAPLFLDDDRLLVPDSEGRINIHSVPDNKPIGVLARVAGPVRVMALSPDRRELAVGLNQSPVVVLDTATGAILRSLGPATDTVTCLDFSPDGSRLATATLTRIIRVFAGDQLLSTINGQPEQINTVCFSHDGHQLWCGSNDRIIRVWDVAAATLLRTLDTPNGFIRPIIRLTDGRMASSGWWWLFVWDTRRDQPVRRFSLPLGLTGMAVGAGSLLWTVDSLGFRLWDTSVEPGITRVTPLHPHAARGMARWNQAGSLLATVDSAGWLRTFGPEGEPRAALRVNTDRLRTIAWHPTQPIVAVGGGPDDNLSFFRVEGDSLTPIAKWPTVRAVASQSFEFSPDGQHVAVGEADRSFTIRRFPDGEVIHRFPTADGGGEVVFARFSPDGATLATGNRVAGVRLWRIADQKLLHTLLYATAPWCVAFAADHRKVYIGTWEKLIHEYDLESGKRLRTFSGHQGFIHDLTFRTNEPMTLASASADGTVRFWDLARESENNVLTFPTPDGFDAMCIQFRTGRPELLYADGRGSVLRLHTRYFNRHIGGNFRAQLEKFKLASGSPPNTAEVERQLEILEKQTRAALAPVAP